MKKYSSITKGNSRATSLSSRIKLVLWVGVVLILLLLVAPRLISGISSTVMVPVVAIEDWIRYSNTTLPVYFRERKSLLKDIQSLERQLAAKDGTSHTISQLQSDNLALRAHLTSTTTKRLAAGVIGRPTELPYDVFLIDQGKKDGVSELAPVFAGSDQAVGYIAKAYARTSVVVLVSSPDIKSTVYIYGPDIYTTAVGMGGGVLRVSVPQGIDLEEGNIVVMPTLGAGVYGEITFVESVSTQPEQYGFVTIGTPLSSLRYVSVGDVPLSVISFEEAKAVLEEVRTDILEVPVPDEVLIEATSTIEVIDL